MHKYNTIDRIRFFYSQIVVLLNNLMDLNNLVNTNLHWFPNMILHI